MKGVALAVLAFAACGSSHARTVDAMIPDGSPDAPPAPLPDLRFKWVGEFPAYTGSLATSIDFSGGVATETSHDHEQFAWTPLEVTLTGLIAGNYSWGVSDFTPVMPISELRAVAEAGAIANLDQDLGGELAMDGVLISIDILPDAYAFVTAAPEPASPLYTGSHVDVARVDLDSWVASQGTAGNVTTALSASPTTAGDIRAYAFSRQGDNTAYETQVVDVTPANIATEAMTLAAGGYYITAFGRVGDNAAVMVGTRAPGASPRTVMIEQGPDLGGYSVVGAMFQTTAPNHIFLDER